MSKATQPKAKPRKRHRSLRADQLNKRTALSVLIFASGLKLEVIARAAGISTSYLSGVLSAKHVPSTDAIERIGNYLCISNPARLLTTISSDDLTDAVKALLGLEALYTYPGTYEDEEVDIKGRPWDQDAAA
ncbi:MAG: helix-turn-helix domain-containing protein [Vulcanimicrobiaceae bacterium]